MEFRLPPAHAAHSAHGGGGGGVADTNHYIYNVKPNRNRALTELCAATTEKQPTVRCDT